MSYGMYINILVTAKIDHAMIWLYLKMYPNQHVLKLLVGADTCNIVIGMQYGWHTT